MQGSTGWKGKGGIAYNSRRAGRGEQSPHLARRFVCGAGRTRGCLAPGLAGRVLPLPMVTDIGSAALFKASPEMLDII